MHDYSLKSSILCLATLYSQYLYMHNCIQIVLSVKEIQNIFHEVVAFSNQQLKHQNFDILHLFSRSDIIINGTCRCSPHTINKSHGSIA
jgi:hypothetical protein